MKIKAISATLNNFTLENLISLAESAEGVPISNNFNNFIPLIGYVLSAKVVDGKLIVIGNLINDQDIDHLFLVPGFLIPDHISKEYAITNKPVDSSLPPILRL